MDATYDLCYPQIMAGIICYIWQCPTCDWSRTRTGTEKWEGQILHHKVYGKIRNLDLYKKDILNHSCEATYRTRLKYGIKRPRPGIQSRRPMIERLVNG